MRRGRGEAAPVSAGGGGGSAGSLLRPARRHRQLPLPLPPSRALRSRFAPALPTPPLSPLLGLTAPLLPPFPGVPAPRGPGRGSFAALGAALARPQRRLVVGPGPARPWRLLAGPGAGWACPALSRSRSCSAVILADYSSVPFPRSLSSSRASGPRPLAFPPPCRSVPAVPSRCPGLRVLLRLGRRWRGPVPPGGRSHYPASQTRRVCGSRSVPLSPARSPVRREGSVLSHCLLCFDAKFG